MNKIQYFLINHCSINIASSATVERVNGIWETLYKRSDLKGPRTFNGVIEGLRRLGIKTSFGIVYGIRLKEQGRQDEMPKRRKRTTYDKERYHRYLASREWYERRRVVLTRCKGICERCGVNEAVIIHHVSYIRIYNELPQDLQAICEPCHKFIHASSDYDPLKDPKLRR